MNFLTESRKWLGMLLMLCVCLMLLMAGCNEKGTKGLSDMTPMERASYMLVTYNTQYDDYMITTGYSKDAYDVWVKTTSPDLSEDQIEILQKKKAILTKVKPLINLYVMLTQGGEVPGVEIQQEIMALLLSLASI